MDRKTASKVSRDRAGSTLIDFLVSRFTYLGREGWERQIDEGRISVNDESVEASRTLVEGDSVGFDSSGIEEPEVDSSIGIVFEDEDFLIVEKNGSLPCHPGGRFFKNSLWFILTERYGAAHIATRLDRETSGLVLVCKSPESARLAQLRQASGLLDKTYLALVHGSFPCHVSARGYLATDEGSAIRKKRRYFDRARPSGLDEGESCETGFELVRTMDSGAGSISLVRAKPVTGRTHQIRATLLGLGFPLVGDKLYGLDEGYFLKFAKGKLEAEDWSRLMLPNQALHCAELRFPGADGLAIAARSEPCWGYPYGYVPCLT